MIHGIENVRKFSHETWNLMDKRHCEILAIEFGFDWQEMCEQYRQYNKKAVGTVPSLAKIKKVLRDAAKEIYAFCDLPKAEIIAGAEETIAKNESENVAFEVGTMFNTSIPNQNANSYEEAVEIAHAFKPSDLLTLNDFVVVWEVQGDNVAPLHTYRPYEPYTLIEKDGDSYILSSGLIGYSRDRGFYKDSPDISLAPACKIYTAYRIAQVKGYQPQYLREGGVTKSLGLVERYFKLEIRAKEQGLLLYRANGHDCRDLEEFQNGIYHKYGFVLTERAGLKKWGLLDLDEVEDFLDAIATIGLPKFKAGELVNVVVYEGFEYLSRVNFVDLGILTSVDGSNYMEWYYEIHSDLKAIHCSSYQQSYLSPLNL